MPQRLPPHYISLVTDTALKVYWYKGSFRTFLRGSGMSEAIITSWAADESKRDFMARLFAQIQNSDSGFRIINAMADALLDQTSYPDLEKLEDSAVKIDAAKRAQNELRKYRDEHRRKAESVRLSAESKKQFNKRQAEVALNKQNLDKLDNRLTELAKQLGTQEAGYDFQTWFYDLVEYFEVHHRRPYTSKGRQIDGSITIDGTTYLIELKFERTQCDAIAVDSLKSKIRSKADNTMGIMVAMSGFSSTAIDGASEAQTPLLLLDHNHLYLILHSGVRLEEVVRRVRRHASQTGQAYLAANEFGG